MAAADDEFITIGWISLRKAFDALELALSACGSETLPEELLVRWIGTGEIPWDCKLWERPYAGWIVIEGDCYGQLEPRPLDVARGSRKGDPKWFSRANLEINFQQSKAHDTVTGAKASEIKLSHTRFRACLHKLAPQPEAPREREETPEPTRPAEREKLEPIAALLREAPREREKAQGAAQWIAADIERMKKAKKISRNITITELSRKLEHRMDTAARRDKTIRPIKARSIENLLRVCGLWPISPSK